MKLKRTPELLNFLATYLADSDAEADAETTAKFAVGASTEARAKIAAQLKSWIADPELPIDEFGSEANRWFSDEDEARTWLEAIAGALDGAGTASRGSETVTKDSNGAVLLEGDSVQVIKDLKVKGGSSDLKRGTLIKKIHLIGDPLNIECRVDGSTLVLKTIFLKKI
jgi:protein PhnA